MFFVNLIVTCSFLLFAHTSFAKNHFAEQFFMNAILRTHHLNLTKLERQLVQEMMNPSAHPSDLKRVADIVARKTRLGSSWVDKIQAFAIPSCPETVSIYCRVINLFRSSVQSNSWDKLTKLLDRMRANNHSILKMIGLWYSSMQLSFCSSRSFKVPCS